MSKASERVKKWRQKTKERIIEAMGGKCVCCGYKDCTAALDLHHIDSEEKDFGFGAMRANPRSWKKIVVELRKCVLICNRCHQELHFDFRKMPETYVMFDEDYVEYRENRKMEPCPICGKSKPESQVTCSLGCAAKKARKVDWDKVDLVSIINQEGSWTSKADLFGVSANALIKRAKKMGFYNPRT